MPALQIASVFSSYKANVKELDCFKGHWKIFVYFSSNKVCNSYF